MNEETKQTNRLEKPAGARPAKRRVGRGSGSGHGKTSTRGSKGQKARAGGNVRRGFEGGQMPLQRRVPKRGFTNLFRVEYRIINVKTLNDAFENNDSVSIKGLEEKGLIKSGKAKYNLMPVKLLGDGDLKKKLTVEIDRVTPQARQKVEAAGGTVKELLPKREKKIRKKKEKAVKTAPAGNMDEPKGKEE